MVGCLAAMMMTTMIQNSHCQEKLWTISRNSTFQARMTQPVTRFACHASLNMIVFTFQTRKIWRSEEHTSELKSLMRISYAVFCLQKKTQKTTHTSKRTIQPYHTP